MSKESESEEAAECCNSEEEHLRQQDKKRIENLEAQLADEKKYHGLTKVLLEEKRKAAASYCQTMRQAQGREAAARKWISDLQSGMWINCVYCGFRYGPKDKTPKSRADMLKEHVEKCPKHPMSALRKEMDALAELIHEALKKRNTCPCQQYEVEGRPKPESCGFCMAMDAFEEYLRTEKRA